MGVRPMGGWEDKTKIKYKSEAIWTPSNDFEDHDTNQLYYTPIRFVIGLIFRLWVILEER